MISKFNRKQTLLACVNFVAGTLALLVGVAFFYFVSQFVLNAFGVGNSRPISYGIVVFGLVVIFVSGFQMHRKGAGTYGYQDSDLMPNWEMETAGSVVVDFYRNRVTAPAHALTQIFLCAPLQFIQAVTRLRSRIPDQPGLEQRVAILLDQINQQDKWQTISDYAEYSTELQYLIRMDAIQFSGRTGKLRAKK